MSSQPSSQTYRSWSQPSTTWSGASTIPARAACRWVRRVGPAYEFEREDESSSSLSSDSTSASTREYQSKYFVVLNYMHSSRLGCPLRPSFRGISSLGVGVVLD